MVRIFLKCHYLHFLGGKISIIESITFIHLSISLIDLCFHIPEGLLLIEMYQGMFAAYG